MKFDTGIPPAVLQQDGVVRVGNVYQGKGGNGGTCMWLVAAIRGNSVHVLGLSLTGEVVSTATYGAHAFEDRTLLGTCAAMFDYNAPIEWVKP